jgi:hypothetical protein
MLKSSILLTTATAAIIASASIAFAQKQNEPQGRGEQPGQSAADKAPGQVKDAGDSARDQAPGQTKGEGESAKSKAPGQTKDDPAHKSGDMKKGDKDKMGAKDADHNQKKSADNKAGDNKAGDNKTGDNKAGDNKTDSKAADSKASDAGKSSGAEAGKSAAGGASGDSKQATEKSAVTNLPPETKTKVKTVFTQHRVEPAKNINISINIGVAVPHSVKLYAVPEEVVTIVPAYRRYRYFLIEDRICIVDPVTFEIVDVIIIA